MKSLEMHPPRMQVFLSQFLRRPTRLQHIAFLFSVEKRNSREKQKVKELHPPLENKNMHQKNLPKAKLHNVILCNSSNESGVLRTL